MSMSCCMCELVGLFGDDTLCVWSTVSVGCEPGPPTRALTRDVGRSERETPDPLCANKQAERTRQDKTRQDTTRHDKIRHDTTPAVKRRRAAVDGLDPDSPRVKRVLARIAHYRAKKADEGPPFCDDPRLEDLKYPLASVY